VRDQLFFWVPDGLGWSLWVTDGTPAATRYVADPFPGGNANNLLGVFNVHYLGQVGSGNRILFGLGRGPGDFWVSDGTAQGTKVLKDIWPGDKGSNPENLLPVGFRRTYFTANDGTHGVELWRTNGTTMGTQMVQDLYPGFAWSSPDDLVLFDGKIFFAAQTKETGRELFSYDPGGMAISIGFGCSARALTPIIETTDPVLGSTVEVTGKNSPLLSVGYLNLGFLADKPVDFGLGCTVYLDTAQPIALIGVVDVKNSTWTESFDVPNDPSLIGQPFVLQAAYLFTLVPSFELSNAVSLNVGR
jgi:ELWxxDGT repeat protein